MTQTISHRNGQALDADQHFGMFGSRELRQGLLSEWVESFLAAGGTIRKSATGVRWAFVPSETGCAQAWPVVCSEIVPVWTEDGMSDGRCGLNATDEEYGCCEGHAAVIASYFASDTYAAERARDEANGFVYG